MSKDKLAKVREEYRHLRWYYKPGKDEKTPNAYYVEALDQYGRWYHAFFSTGTPASEVHPDVVSKARGILRTLDKIRMGQPVAVKFNKDGVRFDDPGIYEGRYDGR